MAHTPENIITPQRRSELADFVGFFSVLIEEDRQQKTLQKYEYINQ